MSLSSEFRSELNRSKKSLFEELRLLRDKGNALARCAAAILLIQYALFGIVVATMIILAATGHMVWIQRELYFLICCFIIISSVGGLLLFFSYPLECLGILFGRILKKLFSDNPAADLLLKPIRMAGELSEDLREALTNTLGAYLSSFAILILIGLLLMEASRFSFLSFLAPVASKFGLAETAIFFIYLANRLRKKKAVWVKRIAIALPIYYLFVTLSSLPAVQQMYADAKKDWTERSKKYEDDQKTNLGTGKTTIPGRTAKQYVPTYELVCGEAIGPSFKDMTRIDGAVLILPASCASGIMATPRNMTNIWVRSEPDPDGTRPPITGHLYYQKPGQGQEGNPLSSLTRVPMADEENGKKNFHWGIPQYFDVQNPQAEKVEIAVAFDHNPN